MERWRRARRLSYRRERGTCTDILVRSFIFAWIAAAALLSPRFVEHGRPGPAAAQEVASQTAMPDLPTPTPTDVVAIDPVASSTDGPGESPTASHTVIPGSPTPVGTSVPSDTPSAATDTPTESATIIGTDTPTPTETATPTPAETATPTPSTTPMADLPELTLASDPIGTVAEFVMGVNGGRASSPDGRFAIFFPPGSTSEELRVRITKKAPAEFTRPDPSASFVGVWQLDAFASVRDDSAVHQFDTDISIVSRLRSNDVAGLDSRTLQFWTFNEQAGAWDFVPSQVDAATATIIVRTNHFSVDAATASKIVDTAPLLHGRNVDLHSGGASFSIPIELPPGRGGLTPQLSLSYDSIRLGEMRTYDSSASWVGIGWELDTPHIQFTTDPSVEPGDGRDRAFLSVDGLAGELIPACAPYPPTGNSCQDHEHDDDGYVWRLRTNPGVKVRATCNALKCDNGWLVWDQSGNKYFFGGAIDGETSTTTKYQQYYYTSDPDGSGDQRYDYRADLRYVEDRFGNRVNYTPHQDRVTRTDLNREYVYASQPAHINYNDSKVRVEFFRGTDEWIAMWGQSERVRFDTPRDVAGCSGGYIAPLVRESDKLARIDVWVRNDQTGVDELFRTYEFVYYDTDRSFQVGGCPVKALKSTGTLRLKELRVRDRNGVVHSSSTTKFEYADKPHSYLGASDAAEWDFEWPHLTRVENGFGGVISFGYTEQGRSDPGQYHWSRSVVTQETKQAGAGQPDVVTTYEYGPSTAPDQYNFPNPLSPSAPEYFESEFAGFPTVTEKDGAGNKVVHKYYTVGSWDDNVRRGREYETTSFAVVKNAPGSEVDLQLERVDRTWSVRPVRHLRSGSEYWVNFVDLTASTTTLQDGTVLTTTRAYDGGVDCLIDPCFGLLTMEQSLGEAGAGDDVTTSHAYAVNTAVGRWLFLPHYEERIDSDGSLLSCARHYYDGASAATTIPTRGLLTATSAAEVGTVAQCEGAVAFTRSTNTYFVYETYATGTATYGNVAKQSVPSSVSPETATVPQTPPSLEWGWIPVTSPTPIAFTETTYDSTRHVFATEVKDPIGLIATTTWDSVVGKPLTISSSRLPNGTSGNVMTNVYDGLGRPVRSYDTLDSDTRPTVRYVYDWDGATPKSTIVEALADTGSTEGTYRRTISCMDGFGREYDAKTMFNGSSYASVRTDYDALGRKASQSNPTGSSDACEPSAVAIRTRDRTIYQYDAAGNLVATMSARGNRADTGPGQWSVFNGRATISLDGNLNAKEQVQHPATRTVDTREPTQLPAVVTIRPTSDIVTQWSRNTGAAFWDHIDDVTPDDDMTFLSETTPNDTSLHGFASPTIPTGMAVTAVRLNLRWKHNNASSPVPDGDMRPVFRQNGVDTLGPAFRSTNSAGWVDDSWTMVLNPRTGQAWTVAEVSNITLAFGFQMRAFTGAAPYVSAANVQVFTRPTAASTTVQTLNGNGNLVSVSDPMSNVTSLSYDLLGHKTAMTDPDMGTWSYAYNPDGTLSTQTDARILTTGTPNTMITTTLSYDAAGRLLSKSFNNGDPSVAFFYDSYLGGDCSETAQTAVGHITKMTDGYGATWSCFDFRGRATKTRRSVDGVNYDIARHYDPLNAVDQLTYPDGEVVAYNENSVGQTTSMTSTTFSQTLLSSVNYEPSGALSWYRLGNDLLSSFSYDFRQRLDSAQTQGAQNLLLTYDDASNIVGYNDDIAADNASFGYDHLNRLTSASYTPGTDTAAYSYNPIGNLLSKQEGAANNTLNYPSSGLPRPHAVTSSSGSLARTYRYDANGNMYASVYGTNQTGAASYGFNAENRLTDVVLAPPYPGAGPGFQCVDQNNDATINVLDLQAVANAQGMKPGRPNFALRDVINDGTVSVTDLQREATMMGQSCPTTAYRYAYDGTGTQIKRTVQQNGTTSSTVYIGGVYEKTNTGAVKKYYTAFGRTVAIRDVPAGSGAGTMYYPVPDHLGSTSTVLDANGAIVSSQRYWPYGATRSGSVPQTDRLYTGQRQEPGDAAMGLYNYKARFYSTTLGRFVSADPRSLDGLNRYSYVNGRPLVLVDPSGLDAAIFCGTGNQCENGTDADNFRGWVIEYWRQHEHIFGGMEEFAFGMLQIVLADGWSYQQTLSAFHVAFVNTTDSLETDIRLAGAERLPGYDDGLEHWQNVFWDSVRLGSTRGIDTLIGYSAGGSVVERLLENAADHSYRPEAVILIQTAKRIHYAGKDYTGFHTNLRSRDLPGTRIVTLNERGSPVSGTVPGAVNFQTQNACDGNQHCSSQGLAPFAIWASTQPLSLVGDQSIAYHLPTDVDMSYGR